MYSHGYTCLRRMLISQSRGKTTEAEYIQIRIEITYLASLSMHEQKAIDLRYINGPSVITPVATTMYIAVYMTWTLCLD